MVKICLSKPSKRDRASSPIGSVAAGNAGLLQAQTQTPAPAPVVAPAVTPVLAAAPTEPVNYPRNPVKPTTESQAKAKSVYKSTAP